MANRDIDGLFAYFFSFCGFVFATLNFIINSNFVIGTK